jgi:hypothetical protein
MAVSTSKLRIGAARKSIIDKLTQQSEGLQDTPWYQTAGQIALPILATMAIPGIGTALASAYAGAGGIGGALGGIGTALASTGGATGITATAKGLTAKSIANLLATKGTKGLLGLFDKRSEKDINLAGMGALEQALGGESVSKLRRDYRASKKETGKMDIAGSIMSALVQEGGLEALQKASRVSFPSSPAPASIKMGISDIPRQGILAGDLTGKKSVADLLGTKQSPMAKLFEGKIPLQDAISEASPLTSVGASDIYKGTTSGSSIYSSILPKPGVSLTEMLGGETAPSKVQMALPGIGFAEQGPTRSPIVNQELAGRRVQSILNWITGMNQQSWTGAADLPMLGKADF